MKKYPCLYELAFGHVSSVKFLHVSAQSSSQTISTPMTYVKNVSAYLSVLEHVQVGFKMAGADVQSAPHLLLLDCMVTVNRPRRSRVRACEATGRICRTDIAARADEMMG